MTVSQDKPISRRQLRDTSRAAEPAAEGDADVESTADLRSRDSRPEGRRSSFAPSFTSASLGGWAPPVDAASTDDASSESTTDTASSDPDPAAASGAGAAVGGGDGWNRPVPTDLEAPERTMTRRELRILRARAEAAGQPAPDVVFLPNGETTVTGAIDILDAPNDTVTADSDVERAPEADAAGVITEQPQAVAATDSEPANDTTAEVIDDAVVVDDTVANDPDASDHADAPEADAAGVITEQPLDDHAREASEPEAVIPALIEPTPGESPRFQTDSGAPTEIVVDAEPLTGETAVSEPEVNENAAPIEVIEDGAGSLEEAAAPSPGTLRPFDALFLPPSAREESDKTAVDTSSVQPANDTDGLRGEILAAPESPAKPYGHWSTQTGDDDGLDVDATLSRDVGVTTGALTTHALVLPSIPDSGEPLLSPLTSTGEVMVTGTIDLPRSFGSTGAHPALFDHPEVDALIDDTDREDADSGIAPVRASRAVSSTTTTRAMIGTETEKKSRVIPIVLIGAGVIVAVVAATIVVYSFMTNQF